MKTYEQLSPAQKKVIQLMKEDQDSYCLESNFYNYQQIVRPNIKDDLYKIENCKRPTLIFLIKSEILIKKEVEGRDKYVLNPKFQIYKKTSKYKQSKSKRISDIKNLMAKGLIYLDNKKSINLDRYIISFDKGSKKDYSVTAHFLQ